MLWSTGFPAIFGMNGAPLHPTTETRSGPNPPRRYEPILKIASGGTATVWVGAAAGALGFRQLVAIKRPHEHLQDDPAFREALVEEAKIAARLRHANAVDVRDVEVDENGIQLVMDWVEGVSLSDLIRAWSVELPQRPFAVMIRVVLDASEGLRAFHELRDESGALLGCVHRDISPANLLVGLDGVSRITDFGLAKPLLAAERTTSNGTLRGKLGYMAPEYVRGKAIDARVDVFAMGIVLWEALARKRLFRGENDAETLDRIQHTDAPKLVDVRPELGDAAPPLDDLIARATAKDPAKRLASIDALVRELETVARKHDLLCGHAEVRDAFGTTLRGKLEERRREVERALAEPRVPVPTPSIPPAFAPLPSLGPQALAAHGPNSSAETQAVPSSVSSNALADPRLADPRLAQLVTAHSSSYPAPYGSAPATMAAPSHPLSIAPLPSAPASAPFTPPMFAQDPSASLGPASAFPGSATGSVSVTTRSAIAQPRSGSRALVWGGLVAVAGVLVALAVARGAIAPRPQGTSRTSPADRPLPRTAVDDRQVRADETRTRATSLSLSALPNAPLPASPPPTSRRPAPTDSAQARPQPSTPPHDHSDEPGKKVPRPNPYPKATDPH